MGLTVGCHTFELDLLRPSTQSPRVRMQFCACVRYDAHAGPGPPSCVHDLTERSSGRVLPATDGQVDVPAATPDARGEPIRASNTMPLRVAAGIR